GRGPRQAQAPEPACTFTLALQPALYQAGLSSCFCFFPDTAPPPSSLSGPQQWLYLQDPGCAPRGLHCHAQQTLCHQVPSDPARHFQPLPVQGAGLPPPAPRSPGPPAAHSRLPRLPPGRAA
uniref:Uncharacterized protein n=1 Tax=Sus scrofa TaxID=9823 RepID=A0A5G2QPX9_PIG